MIKKCVICGKEFETENSRTKTCSEECRYKRRRQTQRNFVIKNEMITEYTKTCSTCGKEFKTYREKQITCSEECSYKNKLKNIRKHGVINKDTINTKRNEKSKEERLKRVLICSVCGKEFHAENKKNICSEECKKERNKKYKEKYRNKKLDFKENILNFEE